MASSMKHFWMLAGMVAILPAILIALALTDQERLLHEFFSLFTFCTLAGIFGLIAFYRELKRPR